MQKKEGVCKLCGERKPLTFEHVPPESAFNSWTVKRFSPETTIQMIGSDDRLPWDFEGFKGELYQRGNGDYYLCADCNNKTGSWYISEYVKLSKYFHEILVSEKPKPQSRLHFEVFELYPLRILKAIMVLYCDINNGCMGDTSLRDFLLDKESTAFDTSKYSLYMYMVSPAMRRINGIAAMCVSNIGVVILSEIGSYPIGTILYINKPSNYEPVGLSINEFAKCGYYDKCKVEFYGIPYLEINSLLPTDFRSKDELLWCIKMNRDQTQESK